MFNDAILVLLAVVAGGRVIARTLRRQGMLWTCAAPGLLVGFLLAQVISLIGFAVMGASLYACSLGRRWHRMDLNNGGDYAAVASERIGVGGVLKRLQQQRQIERKGWVGGGQLVVGNEGDGLSISIPAGYSSGSHTLIVGATGSGKTVSEAWIAGRLIDAGYGAIVIDPKGDHLLRDELRAAAARADVPFLEWTPEGPLAYNPYGHGSDSEIADKALSGEEFTEPHYLRQAQRYLGHAVRVMQAAGIKITPVSLMAHMDPRQLEVSARKIPEEQAKAAQVYLDSLEDRQKRELSGVRDRLSILAESDVRQWLNPAPGESALDLQKAIRKRAVVYFRLDSDRRPLLSKMLAATIISDLVTLTAWMQSHPLPTLVLVDEFSAIAAQQVSRLFGRGRSAAISLLLATQEMADMPATGDGALREQVLGNVEAVIAHRQNVPESAELIAAIAGTKPVWVTTQQTEQAGFGSGESGKGSRRRGHEFVIHPSTIKDLWTGEAVVITPGSGQQPAVTHMHHPDKATTVSKPSA